MIEKNFCDGVSIERKMLRGLFEQLIMYTFGKFVCDRVYFGVFFMRQGAGCGEVFFTPSSLL